MFSINKHALQKLCYKADSRNIPHFCEFVHVVPKKRTLPSGGTMVPECTVGDRSIPGSDAILRHFDEQFGTDFFPNELATELNKRINDGVLFGTLLFYSLAHKPTHTRTEPGEKAASRLPAVNQSITIEI